MRKIEPSQTQKGMEFGLPGKKRNYKLDNMALTPVALASGMVKKHGYKKTIEILNGLARPSFGSGEASTANMNYGYYLQALNWAKKRAPTEK